MYAQLNLSTQLFFDGLGALLEDIMGEHYGDV